MGLHEYQCPRCDFIVERIFSIVEQPPEQVHLCPQCRNLYLNKIISVPAKRRDMTVIGDNKL